MRPGIVGKEEKSEAQKSNGHRAFSVAWGMSEQSIWKVLGGDVSAFLRCESVTCVFGGGMG